MITYWPYYGTLTFGPVGDYSCSMYYDLMYYDLRLNKEGK
jgi:hypothetical protein